jgi:hypothetical protein
VVPVGGSITGNLESTNDDDWFRVTLTAGRSYQFDLEGSDTGQGTLTDPNLSLLSSTGSGIATDFGSGVGNNARITFAPSASGTYYLSSFGSSLLGTYKLSATDITPGPNRPPSITSNGGGDIASLSIGENTAVATTITATDPDAGTTLGYSIVGGADAAQFQINSATGVLSFVAPPNFELPSNSDHDNIYLVEVRASDGVLFDSQAITISVSDLSELPKDFGGDFKSDILWRHDSGQVGLWQMDGAVAAPASIAFAGNDWRIAAAGDFGATARPTFSGGMIPGKSGCGR